MRIAFLLIVLFHGLIHLLGFIKGFGFKEIKELTLPISKSIGLVWLTATGLFLIYGISFLLNYKYNWLVGLLAVLLSQFLIILFWKDAKFGTVLNILIAIVSLSSLGYYHFQNFVHQEATHILNQNREAENRIITKDDIANLPNPVKNWLNHSGIVGKPTIHVGQVTQIAKMQMNPEENNWMTANAIQYTTIDHPAFIWTVDLQMNSLLNIQGRDKFENGKGEMLIKLNSLINVVHECGEKIDEGSLQRYLGEMVWFPSLALSPYIAWEQIDKNTAKATMSYKGTSGSGTFYFDNNGAVKKYMALRYKDNKKDAQRYEWVMDITDHKTYDGIKIPVKMTSTWKLEEGDWTWLKLEVTNIKYNQNIDTK